MFLFTDGITEAENSNNELYSDNALLKCLNNNKELHPKGLVKRVMLDVSKHVQGNKQSDDLTMLCLIYKGNKIENDDTKRITIINKTEELTTLVDMIETLTKKWDLSTSVSMNLNLVLEEAITNIIFHAYTDEEQHEINIDISINEDHLVIKFIDDGIEFNPTKNIATDISLSVEEREIGGLGILFIQKFMDSVEYVRNMNKNILTLHKIIK